MTQLDADETFSERIDGLAAGVGFVAAVGFGVADAVGLLGVGRNDGFTIGRRE